ncbi:CidA/LrgA family protein [Microbacterium gubbeenense]|uniref:CidA/LrgA family protein n=1 Tax=Microbacterium gubbeenense TaxID=159896 RepID=UPI003F97CEE4
MDETTQPARGAPIARWLLGLGLLVAFAAGGNLVQHLLDLPIPGSTIGMIALLVLLVSPVRQPLIRLVSPAADSLIAVLPLLLVPLAVGIVGSFGPLAEHALALAAALVIGWLVTFLTAAFVADLLMRRTRRP